MNYREITLVIFAALCSSIALADDFKTIRGKEYKNATVSRVEPDGIVVKTKSGISKIYFVELPKEVQERYHYGAGQGAATATGALTPAVTPSPQTKTSTSGEQVHRIATPAIAQSTHSASSADDFGKIFGIGVVLVVLVFAAIYASKRSKTVSPAKLAQLQAEAKEFIDKVVATGKITVPDTIPVVLGTDETALLSEPSKLIEARATRVYAGGGTRIRGIYIGGGQSTSVQSLKKLDSGTLTLTTKRLVFTGSMESRVVNIKDIVSVEPIADAIEISGGKKAKRQVYMVHNPVIWVTLIKSVISGTLKVGATKPGSTPPPLPPSVTAP